MEKSEETRLCNNCTKSIPITNFELHYVYCIRNLKVCKLCKENVKISEEEKHLAEYHVSVRCNLCEEPQEKWMLPKHQEVCPKRLVPCVFCRADISFDDLAEHEDFCGSRTERCYKCHQRIMKKDYDAHLESHNRPLIKECKHGEVKEVNQNKANEEIVRTAINGQNRLAKVSNSRDREVTFENSTEMQKEQLEDNSMLAVAAIPTCEKKKKVSRKFCLCPLCEENVSWEDVGTHLPSCAIAFRTCAICLTSVPPNEMRHHLLSVECRQSLKDNRVDKNTYLSYCKYFENGYERQPAELDKIDHCPHCSQICSIDRIALHIQSCPENKSVRIEYHQETTERERAKNKSAQGCSRQPTVTVPTYQCPLCNEEMPEDNKKMHESFYCEVLRNLDKPHSLYSMPDVDTSNKSEKDREEGFRICPYCCEKYSVYKISEHTVECLRKRRPCDFCDAIVLESQIDLHFKNCPKYPYGQRTESYAQVTKNPAYRETEMISCILCNEMIPKHAMVAHKKGCIANRKVPCVYCSSDIYKGSEDIHLSQCVAFNRLKNGTVTSRYADKNKFIVTGAVPKHSNLSSRVIPKMGTCKYCKTTYNADVLAYHETDCVHQEVQCPECHVAVLLKDISKHKCKASKTKGRGKKDKGGQQKTEGTGVASSIMSLFSGLKPGLQRSLDDSQNGRNDAFEPRTNHGSYTGNFQYNSEYFPQNHYNKNEQLYFSQPFMDNFTDNAEIPCEFCNKPFPASEIVVHETGCRPEEVSYSKSVPERQEKKTHPTPKEEVADEKFFVPESRFLPSTKYESIKDRITTSETRPGESLNMLIRQTEADDVVNTESESEKKTVPRKLEAVWNKDSSESESEEIENSVLQLADGQEKMAQDVNKSKKEISDDVEMQSVESDGEVSDMLAVINENSTELCNMMNEKIDQLHDSEETKEDAGVEHKLSSPEIYFSEDVPVSTNKETIEDESVQQNSYKFVSGSDENISDVIESTKQRIESFRFGSYRMEHSDKGDKNESENAKNESHTSKMDEGHVSSSKTVVSNKHEKGPYERAYNYILNALPNNPEPSSKHASHKLPVSKSAGKDGEDDSMLQEKYLHDILDAPPYIPGPNSKPESHKLPVSKSIGKDGEDDSMLQEKYLHDILNAPPYIPGSNSKPVSHKLPVPNSVREDNSVLQEKYSYKGREVEYTESELKVDTEDFPRKGVPCEFCKDEVPTKDYDVHVDFCGSLTTKCILCKKYVKKRDRKMHAQSHINETEKCMKEVSTKKESYPEKEELSEQKAHLNQLIKCAFCKAEVPLESFLVHTDICGSSGYQCKICKNYVKNRDRRLHSQMHSDEKECEKKESAKQNIVKKSLIQKQDMSEEMAKRYTTCKICHQTIKWMDYNTHIPNCASSAGKCAQCGDSVNNDEMKEHVLRKCRKIKQSKPVQNEMLKNIERGRYFYEQFVNDKSEYQYYKQQEQESMPRHYPKEDVPMQKHASNRGKSTESKNPAFKLEPAENYSHSSMTHSNERDSENISVMERRLQESYPTTAENLEKWAKWSRKVE